MQKKRLQLAVVIHISNIFFSLFLSFSFLIHLSSYGFSAAGKLGSGERSSLFDVPPAPQYCYRFFSSFNHSDFFIEHISSISYRFVGDNVSSSPYSVHSRPNKLLFFFCLFIHVMIYFSFISF